MSARVVRHSSRLSYSGSHDGTHHLRTLRRQVFLDGVPAYAQVLCDCTLGQALKPRPMDRLPSSPLPLVGLPAQHGDGLMCSIDAISSCTRRDLRIPVQLPAVRVVGMNGGHVKMCVNEIRRRPSPVPIL